MSRLTQPAIQDGDTLDAASLNDRFTQFNQPGALNAFNLRDAAIDLPHFKAGASDDWLTTAFYVGGIGWNDWKHGSYHTFTGQLTGAAPHVVLDSGSAADYLSFGASGAVIATGSLLRVYWDLSVRPKWVGVRPWTGAALTLTFPNGSGGTRDVFSGYGCWAFWLQWDITSNALTHWVNVPGQGDFNSLGGGTRGYSNLTDIDATSIIQSVIEGSDLSQTGAVLSISDNPVGWSSGDGARHYKAAAGPVTVYGVRVVFTGPLGAHNTGGVNSLMRNDTVAASAKLDQQMGTIQAIVMRTS